MFLSINLKMATVQVSELIFQFAISNFSELKGNVYSPVFSSSEVMLWQLAIVKPSNAKKDYYVCVYPVSGPDEWYWSERSELSITVFAKEIRDNKAYVLLDCTVSPMSTNSSITKAAVGSKKLSKSSLQNGELIIGVKMKSFEYKNAICEDNVTLNPIPKNLVNAWDNHMRNYEVDDVEFNVKGEKFYVSSSILTSRSQYFESMLSGVWLETNKVNNIGQSDVNMSVIEDSNSSGMQIKDDLPNESEDEGNYEDGGKEEGEGKDEGEDDKDNNEDDRDNNEDDKDNNEDDRDDEDDKDNNEDDRDNKEDESDGGKDTIKYHIKITDCDSRIFSEMLSYLYTDNIEWCSDVEDGTSETITIGLFCLADKYLLHDLRQRAKNKMMNELEVVNAANIMFALVPKYNDLREPVLNFIAKNFKEVSKTSEFKQILANPEEYVNFDEIMSEILEEYFKISEK